MTISATSKPHPGAAVRSPQQQVSRMQWRIGLGSVLVINVGIGYAAHGPRRAVRRARQFLGGVSALEDPQKVARLSTQLTRVFNHWKTIAAAELILLDRRSLLCR